MTVTKPVKFTGPVQTRILDGGCYVWRTNKPGAIKGWWFVGRHFAYVGETVDHVQRSREHVQGGGRYRSRAKDWSDLRPTCYRIYLPSWKGLLRSIESILIYTLCPVYNIAKQPFYNFRRIPRWQARMQRNARNMESRWRIVLTSIGLRHAPGALSLAATVTWMYWR